MMKKIFNICCAVGIACTLFSCSEWDDHYEDSATAGGSSATLWQQLKSYDNNQLSDFCEVLEQTKVFRMHKKTPVSYADLLKGGQSFTVVAPLNGTFDKDSLLRLVETAKGDSIVEKYFIQNHLSRSLTSAQAQPADMLMLNSKHISVTADLIENVPTKAVNLHAKNGIIHVSAQPLPYLRSLYETLCDDPDFSVIGEMLRRFTIDEFNAEASVSNGFIEGVPVYIDSVVYERNKLLESIGLINAEDSTYWLTAPTAAGWEKAWQEAEQFFVFDEGLDKRDSLHEYWTTRALLDDAIYNMTLQSSPQDSLISVQYNRLEPEYHVFYKPFASGGHLAGAQPMECSNGILYKTDEWVFTPENTFFKELWSEAEGTHLVTEQKDCTYNIRQLVADSISEGAYLDIVPRTATSNWELTYRVNNTLSGDYDICAIVLPKTVEKTANPNMRPNKFKAVINYVDVDGKAKTFNTNNKQFQNDPEHVDTIVLAEAFHFPTCNYGQNDIKVSVKLSCNISAKETSRFAREMYLDCIYLRPRTTKPEEQ